MNEKKKRYKKESVTLKQSLSLAILLMSQEANRADDKTWRVELGQAIDLLREYKQTCTIVSKG